MIKHYYRPQTRDEALALKAQQGSKGVWLAGGAWLNHKPYADDVEAIISLENLELQSLQTDGKTIRIGSMLCLQDLADNAELPETLREAINLIPSRHWRNQGTLGGEVGAKNPNSPVLPLLIAQNARLELSDGNVVPVEQYLNEGCSDLICTIELPCDQTVALNCLRPSSQGLPVIWGALAKSQDDVRLVLGGASASICRWPAIEQAIQKSLPADQLEALVADSVSPVADIRGSVAYKRYLAGVVVADLVKQIQQEA